FSSRRRHTRSDRDWSSDVCSSDLVASNFNLDENTPFARLPAKAKQIFFEGSPEPITYYFRDFRYTAEFKGISRWLEDQHRDSDSEKLREEIEKLFSVQNCPECGGSRLRAESRAVKMNGKSISDFSALPLEDCLSEFRKITLNSREEQIARQILKETCNRPAFLIEVGVSYLTLDRPVTS